MSVRIIKNCLLFMLSLSWICWYMVQAHRLGSPPHIVFIVADDLGWNDVSWHNPDIVTPNLERLARDGIILNQSYVQPLCTPSRTAFMTGYFPFHVGRQNHVLHSLEPTGIPLKFTLLPEKLREYGYSSHAIGKWHLGYCNWSYTPTYRGFDSFFGFYSGSEDHFTHTRGHKDFLYFNEGTEWQWLNSNIGLDFRQGTSPATNYSGKYSTHVFARIMTNLLSTLDPSVPHFFYLPFQAVHSPLQVPKKYMRFYENIRDKSRRKFSGMVTALDEAVGKIVANLKKYGFYRNSVIVFVTDNGGQVQSGGNNWPLRGNKGTLWEGGTRGPAFVHSRLLEEKGYVSNKLVHAVDWYPTFVDIAGGQPDMTVDGVSQWTTLRTNGPEVRNEFVYNIFDTGRKPLKGAIRVGNFKLIKGFPGNPSGWIPPPSVHFTHEPTQHCYVRRNGNEQEIRLFNIQDDPTERYNLVHVLPDRVKQMIHRLEEYRATMVPADNPPDNDLGNPRFWNGIFSPGWCEAH